MPFNELSCPPLTHKSRLKGWPSLDIQPQIAAGHGRWLWGKGVISIHYLHISYIWKYLIFNPIGENETLDSGASGTFPVISGTLQKFFIISED